jgi:hypothetical protein
VVIGLDPALKKGCQAPARQGHEGLEGAEEGGGSETDEPARAWAQMPALTETAKASMESATARRRMPNIMRQYGRRFPVLSSGGLRPRRPNAVYAKRDALTPRAVPTPLYCKGSG